MGFSSKRQSPTMPPLVEVPKGGEPIVFDEEEQQAIDKYVRRQFETQFNDQTFSKETTEKISQHFAADALRNIVKRRLSHSDLKGAASSSLKILGIALEIMPSDYLTLAEIFALHGDSMRAKNFVEVANKTAKKLKFDRISNAGWKIRVREVMDIVDSI